MAASSLNTSGPNRRRSAGSARRPPWLDILGGKSFYPSGAAMARGKTLPTHLFYSRKWLAGDDETAPDRGWNPGNFCMLDSEQPLEAYELGQKTPPFAGANRRGRNREEAIKLRVENNPPCWVCQYVFCNIYKTPALLTLGATTMSCPSCANLLLTSFPVNRGAGSFLISGRALAHEELPAGPAFFLALSHARDRFDHLRLRGRPVLERQFHGHLPRAENHQLRIRTCRNGSNPPFRKPRTKSSRCRRRSTSSVSECRKAEKRADRQGPRSRGKDRSPPSWPAWKASWKSCGTPSTISGWPSASSTAGVRSIASTRWP